MEVYLVGGAVRDAQLGLPIVERDYVVVGGCPDKLLAQGYQQVGKSFPVFLHPETKEEYALARTERKISKGYHGFECDVSSEVTLEDDLARRDLTINAIAQTSEGKHIDPYGGLQDLENKVLRHVTSAFREDPVRLLRTARFAARFADKGFEVHSQTIMMMYDMVSQGECHSLIPERVWKETEKALHTNQPHVYFQVLRKCGALAVIFPEIHALFGVPATKVFHAEIDTGVHTMMVLAKASELTTCPITRFAALMHDLGKACTSFDDLPSHPNHAEKGVLPVKKLCERLKVPNVYSELAIMCAKYHTQAHKSMKLDGASLLQLLYSLDAFRNEQRFKQFLMACKADAYGRILYHKKGKPKPEISYPQFEYLWDAYQAASQVNVQEIIQSGAKGADIKTKLIEKQSQVLQCYVNKINRSE